MRLFIVDESDIIVWRLLTMLSSLAGVELVGRARSAREACQELPVVEPDVLLLDFHLADGGAGMVLDTANRLEKRPLVITLVDQVDGYADFCHTHGADYVFDKTNEFTRVHATIKAALDGQALIVPSVGEVRG